MVKRVVFFIFTLIVSVKYLEIMIFDCLSSNLYLWSLHLWPLHLWLFICDLFICDSSSVISLSVTLHLWLFICDLFICDSSSVISSSVSLHLWSLLWYNSSPDIRTLQLKGHTSNQAIYQMYWDHRWRVTDEEITDEESQMKRSQMKSHRWRAHR
jgi:hypothetical protein